MPVYEYQPKEGYDGCDYCKEGFEIMQKINDDPLDKCPKCESPLEKIISKTSFNLGEGGVGWADTGYSGSKKPDTSEKPKD